MTSYHPNPTSCDGLGLLAMFESALRLVEANVPELNRLNVFPVPDGDTGTNMYLTLRDVVANTAPLAQDSVSETSRAMARAALMGGRGNSGVLLSHFFMGMADALEGCAECGGADFSRSLASASVQAYGGIGHPKEGTILTVMRESADAAGAIEKGDLESVIQTVTEAALDSVTRTPTLLPVLARAGLVDAGGYGFYVMLEGMRRHIQDVGELDEMLVVPQPDMSDGNISAEFLEDIEEEEFGFCTQFLLTGEGLSKDSIMARLLEFGQSPVVVGTEDLIRIHVHTYNPDELVAYAGTLGEVSNENIQDMDEQRRRYSADRRAELVEATTTAVAVVQGEGLEQVLRDQGIENFVSGGDTMNPSVADLLRAVEDAPSDSVLLLPNNPNILLAAEQAAGLSSKRVRVVPSRTVVQGIAAALEYFPEGRSLDDLSDSMRDRLGDVVTGEVCAASRDAELDGIEVRENQIMALQDRALVFAADSVEDALKGLLDRATTDESEIVTLYWGEPIDETQAERLAEYLTTSFPDLEFELVQGGQPHYHFFVSIE